MAELVENESEVSDIDPEELANLIKGVDDMDDELFGFSSKIKQGQKPKVEINSDDELQIKTKSVFKDSLPSDPLADVSLTDDDFYNGTGGEVMPSAATSTKIEITKTEEKSSHLLKTSPLKTSRTKKIVDLFGLDEDADQNMTKENKKIELASDWLGIKGSPDKMKQADLTKITERVGKDTELFQTTHENTELKPGLDSINLKKNVVFDIASDLEESFQTRRRKSSSERLSKFQNLEGKENDDDVFDLLEDKGVVKAEPKISTSRGVLDDTLNETIISNRTRTSRHISDEKTFKGENASLWEKPSEQINEGQYTLSVGASRRSGFSRRQDASVFTKTNTPPTSLKIIEDNWPTPSVLQEKSNQQIEVVKKDKEPAKQQSSNAKETKEKLPSWLGGTDDASQQLLYGRIAVLQDKEQKLPAETSQDAIKVAAVKHHPKEKEAQVMHEMLLNASSAQSEQTTLALQRTEAQLMAVLQLKQQRQNMDIVCQRQTQLLEVQEQQLNSLVEQHLRTQAEVRDKLQTQQERIGLLLQTLMATDTRSSTVNIPPLQLQPTEIPGNAPVSKDQTQSEAFVAEIQADLKKCRAENQDLNIRIQFLEKTHQRELTALSQAHQHDLEIWNEQKEKFKVYIKQIQEDYETRIQQLQESATEQLQMGKNWMDKLQSERISDLNKLGEFYRVQFEQMSAMYQMLPRDLGSSRPDINSLVTIKKPSNEIQLSAREAALIQKEVELAAIEEKLVLQRQNLETKSNELEEKVEQERMKNEEVARQLKIKTRELNTKEQLWLKEQEQLKEQHETQIKYIKELRENFLREQTQLLEDKLHLAEEKARLEALSKLHGIAPNATFDILQAQAEVHGALEATRSFEIELGEERQRLCEVQRVLELERWKLQEYDKDLAAKAEHLDHMLQVSESNKEEGLKALDQAKKIQQTAEERFANLELRMKSILEREQKLIKEKMEFSQEEMRLNKRREQLDQILPELSAAESMHLQPVSKTVIDPKLLIMKLKAEKELETFGC